jgi:hypothetical protein
MHMVLCHNALGNALLYRMAIADCGLRNTTTTILGSYRRNRPFLDGNLV